MRQFCDSCGRKIIEGHCPDPCEGDGRKIFRVMDSDGGEIVCDIVRAKDATAAREVVRQAHLGERVKRYFVDELSQDASAA